MMATIAREQIVAPRAGQQHFHTLLPRQAADVEHIERRRIGQRLIQLRHHSLQILRHSPSVYRDHIQRHAQMLGNSARIG